jgi:acetylornithine deacetylase/succinyl-diaminopimelate desuccinylase-like protein
MAGHEYREILKRIDEDDVVRICTELIRFRSVNPPGNELEIARYVGVMLSEAVFEFMSRKLERIALLGIDVEMGQRREPVGRPELAHFLPQ